MEHTDSSNWPPVSVIVPVYNEALFIERCLSALLTQDYPGLFEIICVDGMSEDGTRQIISRIAAGDQRVRLVDNPRRVIPAALNIGFREARYDLVARMDAHTLPAPDYLRQCVIARQQSGAENVGGRWRMEGDTYLARAIAAAMESRFGVGTGQWRGGKTAGEADTVPFGMWSKKTVLALGGFNEHVLINEDYEFNYRLRASGGRVYYSPAIQATYYPRRSLSALWRQYFRYGFWKARVLKMHPTSFRLRHGLAPLFVAGLVGGAILSIFSPLWRYVYGGALAAYGLLALLFAACQAARHGWRYLPIIPLIFFILHTAWGSGFYAGIWHWWIRGEGEHDNRQTQAK
jgi:succinoglycan biosynthesis protein ExoA